MVAVCVSGTNNNKRASILRCICSIHLDLMIIRDLGFVALTFEVVSASIYQKWLPKKGGVKNNSKEDLVRAHTRWLNFNAGVSHEIAVFPVTQLI